MIRTVHHIGQHEITQSPTATKVLRAPWAGAGAASSTRSWVQLGRTTAQWTGRSSFNSPTKETKKKLHILLLDWTPTQKVSKVKLDSTQNRKHLFPSPTKRRSLSTPRTNTWRGQPVWHAGWSLLGNPLKMCLQKNIRIPVIHILLYTQIVSCTCQHNWMCKLL